MKNIVYTLILLLTISSCDREEFLDLQPKGQLIPSKINDYRLLLDQTERFGSATLTVISPGFVNSFSNTEYASDDITVPNALLTFFEQGSREANIYLWEDQIYNLTQEDPDWQNLYGQIYVANIVIEEILEASDGTMDQKLALKAEALAQRAIAYFFLANIYGKHYDPSTADSDKAVPLRLTTELISVDLSRATVKEVYNLIIDDLNEAVDHLPDTPELVHRPSKAGVHALLSRIHLYMGNYELSKNEADRALALQNTVTDFNTYPNWFFPGIADMGMEPQNDPEIIWHKSFTSPYGFDVVSDDFLNILESNDQRRRRHGPMALFGLSGPEQIYVMGFVRNFKPVGPSVPEMLLTRAECNARLNNLSSALLDINRLRENRMDTGTFTPLSSTDQNEVLSWAKRERRLELILHGHRFFDLKRYNVYDTPKIDIMHTYNGDTYTLSANSNNWVLPIAPKYIAQNPEMGENVRD